MYLSTSTSTEDFPEMYLSTFQVLYKLYLSTDVLKYKVLLPGSAVRQSDRIDNGRGDVKLGCAEAISRKRRHHTADILTILKTESQAIFFANWKKRKTPGLLYTMLI